MGYVYKPLQYVGWIWDLIGVFEGKFGVFLCDLDPLISNYTIKIF